MTTKKAVKKTVTDITVAPAAKGRKHVDPNETKEMKLSRLGAARVQSATTRIRLVGNLAAYKPTDPQIDKIMTALGEACARVEARLRGTRAETTAFSL